MGAIINLFGASLAVLIIVLTLIPFLGSTYSKYAILAAAAFIVVIFEFFERKSGRLD